MEENVTEIAGNEVKKKKKPLKSGIIYLSRVPTLMNVAILRRYFESFGELGRVFLQPDFKAKSHGKRGRVFSEGWIEFQSKKVAKRVAASLNNTEIGGKKRNQWREELWNMKYLHGFKWAHLNERLAYERAAHSQRMRAEISQAKREANFYIQNAERTQKQKHIEKKRMKKKLKEAKDNNESETATLNETIDSNEKVSVVNFNETEDETKRKQMSKFHSVSDGRKKPKVDSGKDQVKKLEKRKAFLSNLFSGGLKVAGDED